MNATIDRDKSLIDIESTCMPNKAGFCMKILHTNIAIVQENNFTISSSTEGVGLSDSLTTEDFEMAVSNFVKNREKHLKQGGAFLAIFGAIMAILLILPEALNLAILISIILLLVCGLTLVILAIISTVSTVRRFFIGNQLAEIEKIYKKTSNYIVDIENAILKKYN